MRLLSHPQHNLLRWEGGCEPMAEGESIMALLYPSGLRFTVPASSTSLCENKQGGRHGRWGWGWHEVLWPAVTRIIWAMLCTLTDIHSGCQNSQWWVWLFFIFQQLLAHTLTGKKKNMQRDPSRTRAVSWMHKQLELHLLQFIINSNFINICIGINLLNFVFMHFLLP